MASRSKSEDIYVATETGVVEFPGDATPFHFFKGETRVRAGHPVLKACPMYFKHEIYTVTPDGTLRG